VVNLWPALFLEDDERGSLKSKGDNKQYGLFSTPAAYRRDKVVLNSVKGRRFTEGGVRGDGETPKPFFPPFRPEKRFRSVAETPRNPCFTSSFLTPGRPNRSALHRGQKGRRKEARQEEGRVISIRKVR